MSGRKNPFVKMGRPPHVTGGHSMKAPKAPKMGNAATGPSLGANALGSSPGPMDGFTPSVPGASFRRGGGVRGYRQMAQHHDDPNYCKGGRVR